MTHKLFKQASLQLFTLVTLCFILFGFRAKIGLDSYEIYLNDKLVLQQYVNQPLHLRKLQLDRTKDQDQLKIYYKHCQTDGAGTNRSIVVKDQMGKILKKWTFANVKGPNNAMVIPVKELRQLEKNHALHQLSLHYNAQEHPKGELLTALSLK